MDISEQLNRMRAGHKTAVAGLAQVIATPLLSSRPPRSPSYEAENRALRTLLRDLAADPKRILQSLCDTALELCQAHSAGISILEGEGDDRHFRWQALSGEYAPYLQGMTPHDFGPCGLTVESDAPLLLQEPGRYFTYLHQADPPIVELLLVPFHLDGNPVGTVWVISHDQYRRFDAEDARLLLSLADFAATAWQSVAARMTLEKEIAERKHAEQMLRERAEEIVHLNERLRMAMTETHHRVKNNLQLISALIDMQQTDDREMVPMSELARLGQNVSALGVIHDVLTQEAKSADEHGQVARISVKAVFDKLLPMLRTIMPGRLLCYSAEDTLLPGRLMTALMVITNELVSNAIKHGKGKIELHFRVVEQWATLEVLDDGPGFPEGFDAEQASNTGLDLIENMSRLDLRGRTLYRSRAEGGGHVSIQFPLPPTSAA